MSKERPKERPKEQLNQISLEYGNIIRIISTRNADIHEKTFFIDYVDETRVQFKDENRH